MPIKTKLSLWNILSSGLPKDYDLDVLRKIISVNLIIVFGIIFLGLLGTVAFLQNGIMLGIIDYTFLIFLIWLIFVIRKTKNYTLPVLIGTIATGCFYFYLIASGGVHNTAYIWALTYPLISLFLLGIKLGTLLSLILLLLTGIVFAFGGQISFLTSYDINIVLRFIPAYLAMLLFAYTSEKIRSAVQDKLWGANAELLEAVSKLKHANQMRTELFNIATHDLKNPLNSIKSGADLLLKEKLEAEERDEMLEIISKSSDTMISLISDLLNSEEIESAEFALTLEEVNLCDVLDEVVDELRIFASRKKQNIICDKLDPLNVICDRFKIKMVFQNIIDNAIKYSYFGTTITITVKSEFQKALIQVKDEGEGFSEDDKKNAFGKFKRLSAKPTAGESSTGLGLSIVKSIVELHNGSVWIESQKGKGTTFNVILPKYHSGD